MTSFFRRISKILMNDMFLDVILFLIFVLVAFLINQLVILFLIS